MGRGIDVNRFTFPSKTIFLCQKVVSTMVNCGLWILCRIWANFGKQSTSQSTPSVPNMNDFRVGSKCWSSQLWPNASYPASIDFGVASWVRDKVSTMGVHVDYLVGPTVVSNSCAVWKKKLQRKNCAIQSDAFDPCVQPLYAQYNVKTKIQMKLLPWVRHDWFAVNSQ